MLNINEWVKALNTKADEQRAAGTFVNLYETFKTFWVYEQGCLAECFKLPINLMANLLIYRVSSSTDLNHKCTIGELNLFLFFFERWQHEA